MKKIFIVLLLTGSLYSCKSWENSYNNSQARYTETEGAVSDTITYQLPAPASAGLVKRVDSIPQ